MRALTVDDEANAANMARREQRGLKGADLGLQAHTLYGTLGSWQKVADEIGYANGSVARRAAFKYRASIELAEAAK